MTNVIVFPGGTAEPELRFAPSPETWQTAFTPDHAAKLTFEDSRLYGWASRDGRRPFD